MKTGKKSGKKLKDNIYNNIRKYILRQVRLVRKH